MNQNKVKLIVTVIITLFLSIYLGIGAASAQKEVLNVVGVFVLIAVILGFGKRIWLLVPLTMLSSLSFRWLPGSWQATDLAFIIALFGSVLLFLTRNLDYKLKLRSLHFIGFLVFLSVIQVYMRNPVGLAVFGTANIGGRAYFTFGVSVMVCLMFSVLRVSPREIFTFRKFAVIGGIFTVVVQWLAYVPGLGLPLAIALGTGNHSFMNEGGPVAGERQMAGRSIAGGDTGRVFSRILVGFTSPLKALFFNWWALIVLLALLGAMISGFRSQLGNALLIMTLGVFYWQGFRGVIIGTTIAVLGLMFIAVINTLIPLPGEVQRALSFLPGSWEERWVREGEDSTDWRVDMWKAALFSEKWIENKTFGDGLGFTAEELELQEAMMNQTYNVPGIGNLDSHQVSLLINGDYHSGPVSFVRAVGYLGLALFWIGQIAIVISSHRLIKSVRGSPYFGPVLFVCIPAIAHPIGFTFVFGTFSRDIALFFLNIGLLSFLRNNIDFTRLHQDPRERREAADEVTNYSR